MLIMAGGTGGHVYPALAVAEVLRSRGVQVVWVGTRKGFESKVVPAAGFEIDWIEVSGLRGKGLMRKLAMPIILLRACFQTARVILRRKPNALLGMGGFVAGPGGVMGWLLRCPLVIHEANALAGLTNRILSPIARRVLTGFPDVARLEKRARWVGNPVRREIAELPPPADRYAARRNGLRLLIFGGSQGARIFNEALPGFIANRRSPAPLQIRHQCGRDNRQSVEDAYHAHSVPATVEEFIDDMAAAYRWADLVICRSGAMTVAEICAAGVAAVLVPFPFAVGDHQTANASFLAKRNAAFLLSQDALSAAALDAIFELDRTSLCEVATNARQLSRPDATTTVVDECVGVMGA